MSELKISEEARRVANLECGRIVIAEKGEFFIGEYVQLAINSAVEPRDKRIAELELKVADRNEWQDVAIKVSAQRDELQKQIDLDTGNITRMQEAGFKAQERIEKFEKDLAEWKEHAAISDREFLQISDWLIGNAEFDPKTGLINHSEKLKERIRDLVANEGRVEELEKQTIAIRDLVQQCLTKSLSRSEPYIPHYVRSEIEAILGIIIDSIPNDLSK